MDGSLVINCIPPCQDNEPNSKQVEQRNNTPTIDSLMYGGHNSPKGFEKWYNPCRPNGQALHPLAEDRGFLRPVEKRSWKM